MRLWQWKCQSLACGRAILTCLGQTGGYHAFLRVDPSRGANVVVLANSATNIDDIGLHLIDRGCR